MANLLDIKDPLQLKEAIFRSGYKIDRVHGTIQSPGKFEGEYFPVLYYHELMMEGEGEPIFADPPEDLEEDEEFEQEVIGDWFEVSPLEKAAFGIEENFAILWYSPSGFVGLEFVDKLPE